MIIAIIIAVGSVVGIMFLYMRYLSYVRAMTPEELAGILQKEQPLLTQAWEKITNGLKAVWHTYLRTRILSFLVKKVYQLRIIIMRAEQMLFRIASRLRARSVPPAANTPPSNYWKDIHGWRKTVHWHKKEGR